MAIRGFQAQLGPDEGQAQFVPSIRTLIATYVLSVAPRSWLFSLVLRSGRYAEPSCGLLLLASKTSGGTHKFSKTVLAPILPSKEAGTNFLCRLIITFGAPRGWKVRSHTDKRVAYGQMKSGRKKQELSLSKIRMCRQGRLCVIEVNRTSQQDEGS